MRTLLHDLDAQIPPFEAYYSARKWPRGPLAGPRVIAERSGISYRTVQRLSKNLSWKGMMNYASDFIAACGFERQRGNVFVMRRHNEKRRRARHKTVVPLARLTDAELRRYDELCRQWNEAMNKTK